MMDFQEVYNLYFQDVYRYALSLTRNVQLAEEITQETFFKALKSIDSFRGQCKLYVWLCAIARNTYFSYANKQAKEEKLIEPSNGISLEEKLLEKEDAFGIHKILHRLPEPYKEVFSLRVFGELSFAQIGELFEKTESWARVTYYRARLKIKEEMR
uniref:RNA polymerase sigma factor n=1 Tax=Acetatifactor sp. TaxID=1872090 RepID=UPI004056CC13